MFQTGDAWRNADIESRPRGRLSMELRQQIFAALVNAQDLGTMTPLESRKYIAGMFRVSMARVNQIADEGIDKDWPPLVKENLGVPAGLFKIPTFFFRVANWRQLVCIDGKSMQMPD